jgi:WD40 repeat protein
VPARCELRDPSIDPLLPNWSPDACRIVFSLHAPGGDVANIAIVDADGRRIVFARRPAGGTRDLFTMSRQAITSPG